MCRLSCGVLLVLVAFLAILGLWGFDAFLDVLLIALLGISLGLVFMPRRGAQNAYRNRVVLSVGAGLLLGIGVGFGGAVVWTVLKESGNLPDVSAELCLTVLLVPILAGAHAPMLWVWCAPTRSRWRLRRKHPKVTAAIERYRKPGEMREMHTPALVLGGRRCFLVYYYDRKRGDRFQGAVLLDEYGRVVDDRGLAERAVKMKHLAMETIDYYRHQARARDLKAGGRAIRRTKNVFRVLREQRERFAAQGIQGLSDWERVIAVEEVMLSILEASFAASLLEAEWAKGHDLGRITEVREEEYLEFETKLLEIRSPYLRAGVLAEVSEPARRLAEVVRMMSDIPHAQVVAGGLLGIARVGQSSLGYARQEFRYARLRDESWQAWRERTAWAKEVEAARGELGMATP